MEGTAIINICYGLYFYSKFSFLKKYKGFLMDFPLTAEQAVMALVIVILGAVLQGSVGFGLGPFAVPLLVLIDQRFVPGALLCAAITLNFLVFWRERNDVDSGDLRWMIFGRIAGTILGAGIILIFPKDKLSLLFAVMILLAVFFSISGIKLAVNIKNLFSAGILSGVMSVTASIGGAPLALLYQDNPGPRLRSTLAALFFFGTIIAVIALAVIGRFGWLEIKLALLLFPGILFGFYLSKFMTGFLDRGFMKPAILLVSGGAAAALIVQQFI